MSSFAEIEGNDRREQPMSPRHQRAEMPAPTIMQIIDSLEAAVEQGKPLPIGGSTLVDRHLVLDLIDRLRRTLPMELEQARHVTQQRQEIIIQAQSEALRIVEAAQEQADYLVGGTGVMAEAKQRGEERLQQAEDNAQRTRDGVERYAISVIEDLESALQHQLNELTQARDVLHRASKV